MSNNQRELTALEAANILAKYLQPHYTQSQTQTPDTPITNEARDALESNYKLWLRTLFPEFVTDNKTKTFTEFAEYHEVFWQHVFSIQPGIAPTPFCAFWPRGGSKSTSAELAATYLTATEKRKYILYVCANQDKADDHVQNIATLLETSEFAHYYPKASNRRLNKFGAVKGWRRNRLQTSSGTTIDAIGMDSAFRGAKIDANRPDVIIVDDIDELTDTPAIILDKIDQLTKKLFMAGSGDVAIIFVQNLIHENSIASQIVNHTVDFLQKAIISGPYPALKNFVYESNENGTKIISGTPTWQVFDLQRCQEEINRAGITAFLTECQHEVYNLGRGLFAKIKFKHHDLTALAMDPNTYELIPLNPLPTFIKVVVVVDPAITDTAKSDSHGIACAGVTSDNHLYILYAWEQKASPEYALHHAILTAANYNANHVRVETDQGGDTWEALYYRIYEDMIASGEITVNTNIPFASEKAGMHQGNKVHRATQMLASYERGEIIHVINESGYNGESTHITLERALRRFPEQKPFDLVDACYWCWFDLYAGAMPIEYVNDRSPVIVRTPDAKYKPLFNQNQRQHATLFGNRRSPLKLITGGRKYA